MLGETKEKLNVYLKVKWLVMSFVAVFFLIEVSLGILAASYLVIAACSMVPIWLNGWWLNFLLKKSKVPAFQPFLSLALDTVALALGIYFIGGSENLWWFLMVFPVFVSGYVFSLGVALFFAALASALIGGIFALEFNRVIPHFRIHLLPEYIFHNLNYLVDYAMGMFILYFTGALISGWFNRLMRKTTDQLGKSLVQSQEDQKEAENSRLAMQNIMEDLARTRDELEHRVKERTAELEEAKKGLEQKVSDRTIALEQSRKAIMHMMKDLKDDMNKLQVIDRMKTEFLSMVSHELRTPITPIKGYLALLMAGRMGELPAKQREVLQILSNQSDHLEDLIGSLLDISRLELGKPIPTNMQPLSLVKIFTEVIQALRITTEGRGLKLELKTDKDLPTVIGDDLKLKRILTNLVGNASKFTSKGGLITVQLSLDGPNIRVEVVDNGLGLAREYKEKIFEKFFQVDSSYTRAAGGIGMGLAIARELVELHGGKIWAESDGLGRGAKFIFTLPIEKKGDK